MRGSWEAAPAREVTSAPWRPNFSSPSLPSPGCLSRPVHRPRGGAWPGWTPNPALCKYHPNTSQTRPLHAFSSHNTPAAQDATTGICAGPAGKRHRPASQPRSKPLSPATQVLSNGSVWSKEKSRPSNKLKEPGRPGQLHQCSSGGGRALRHPQHGYRTEQVCVREGQARDNSMVPKPQASARAPSRFQKSTRTLHHSPHTPALIRK